MHCTLPVTFSHSDALIPSMHINHFIDSTSASITSVESLINLHVKGTVGGNQTTRRKTSAHTEHAHFNKDPGLNPESLCCKGAALTNALQCSHHKVAI